MNILQVLLTLFLVNKAFSQNRCEKGEVRLVGGLDNTEGRVELCVQNNWGTVCDDYWGSPEVTIVCRQLGFTDARPLPLRAGFFGSGGGMILLDNLLCNGTEANLLQCSHNGLGIHDCEHSEDAGVICLLPCKNETQTNFTGVETNTSNNQSSQTNHTTNQTDTSGDNTSTNTTTCSIDLPENYTINQTQNQSCNSLKQPEIICKNFSEKTVVISLGLTCGVLLFLLVGLIIGWICTSIAQNKKFIGKVSLLQQPSENDSDIYDILSRPATDQPNTNTAPRVTVLENTSANNNNTYSVLSTSATSTKSNPQPYEVAVTGKASENVSNTYTVLPPPATDESNKDPALQVEDNVTDTYATFSPSATNNLIASTAPQIPIVGDTSENVYDSYNDPSAIDQFDKIPQPYEVPVLSQPAINHSSSSKSPQEADTLDNTYAILSPPATDKSNTKTAPNDHIYAILSPPTSNRYNEHVSPQPYEVSVISKPTIRCDTNKGSKDQVPATYAILLEDSEKLN